MSNNTIEMRGEQPANATQHSPVSPRLIATIRERHRAREDFLRAEVRLTLQIKAICRRLCDGKKEEGQRLYKALKDGDHPQAVFAIGYLTPFFAARDAVEASRKEHEKALQKLARELPVYGFMQSVAGLGELSLAQIIGECGDLSNYPNRAKLWKRMGLGLVGNGIQRRVKGAEGLEHGYSPRRRAVIAVVGDNLIRAGAKCCYREFYDHERARQHAKAISEGLIPATSVQDTVDKWAEASLPPLEKVSKIVPTVHRSAGHMGNRASRHMQKRLLRDLWRQWRNELKPPEPLASPDPEC